MSRVKQVIVIRKDINMRKGKMCAQSSHASMKVFLDNMEIFPDGDNTYYAKIDNITSEMKEWLTESFTKVVVSVNSEEEIYELADKATKANIPHAVIIDNGFTEFRGNKTTTCIAIGPDDSDKIDELTGGLSLL